MSTHSSGSSDTTPHPTATDRAPSVNSTSISIDSPVSVKALPHSDSHADDPERSNSAAKKKQKRNKPTLSCGECVERKTKVSLPFYRVVLSFVTQTFAFACSSTICIISTICGAALRPRLSSISFHFIFFCFGSVIVLANDLVWGHLWRTICPIHSALFYHPSHASSNGLSLSKGRIPTPAAAPIANHSAGLEQLRISFSVPPDDALVPFSDAYGFPKFQLTWVSIVRQRKTSMPCLHQASEFMSLQRDCGFDCSQVSIRPIIRPLSPPNLPAFSHPEQVLMRILHDYTYTIQTPTSTTMPTTNIRSPVVFPSTPSVVQPMYFASHAHGLIIFLNSQWKRQSWPEAKKARQEY